MDKVLKDVIWLKYCEYFIKDTKKDHLEMHEDRNYMGS